LACIPWSWNSIDQRQWRYVLNSAAKLASSIFFLLEKESTHARCKRVRFSSPPPRRSRARAFVSWIILQSPVVCLHRWKGRFRPRCDDLDGNS
jgi:hypothetical protein